MGDFRPVTLDAAENEPIFNLFSYFGSET